MLIVALIDSRPITSLCPSLRLRPALCPPPPLCACARRCAPLPPLRLRPALCPPLCDCARRCAPLSAPAPGAVPLRGRSCILLSADPESIARAELSSLYRLRRSGGHRDGRTAFSSAQILGALPRFGTTRGRIDVKEDGHGDSSMLGVVGAGHQRELLCAWLLGARACGPLACLTVVGGGGDRDCSTTRVVFLALPAQLLCARRRRHLEPATPRLASLQVGGSNGDCSAPEW
ncbi:uncharacterized protein [Symphalangus syndactylus]|uniref:uncharacterized protein n=1 Tax=Symphalangus syndactylus TaxID=9590 RepID=UPI003003C708